MCVHGSHAVYCTTELCLSVDKLKKKKSNNWEGTMLVYRVQMKKLRILALLLDWKRCSNALSRHHSSVVSIWNIRTIQESKPKFLCQRLRSQFIQMFRGEICSVVLRVHSTHR